MAHLRLVTTENDEIEITECCPFCGSDNVCVFPRGYPETSYEANCNNCGAVGPCGKTEQAAAIYWNERTKPSECEELA